jgi:5-methyltetrahydropteroyltriglutamate--homocysteine methyltransferase
VNPDVAFDAVLRADNASFEGARRQGVTLALHLCRGNYRSHWMGTGGYDAIAERLFNSLDVDRFLLEYDSERAGSFEPLRFVPKGKSVVLGLVTTKHGGLESQDDLLRKIDEAGKYMPVEDMAISPQCGFATDARGNALTWDEQRKKLELVVDTAHKVWG